MLSNAMQDEVDPEIAGQERDREDRRQPAGARTADQDGCAKIHNRLLPNNQIGHNKFVVYVDKNGKASAVLLGSTNWTPTGLCAQTNNTIVLDKPAVAARYWSYWKALASRHRAGEERPEEAAGRGAADLRRHRAARSRWAPMAR